MSEQSELTATFVRERNVFENDDGSRVVIASVKPSKPCDRGNQSFGGEVTVKGDWSAGELKPNLEYRFWGHWLQHHRHGWQFIASTQVAEEPVTAEAVIAYLVEMGKGLGVGQRTAEALWQKYRGKAVEQVRNWPAEACKDISRFSDVKAIELSKRLKVNHKIERAKIDLIGLLSGRGFPKKTIQLALTAWGSAAAWVIRRSPYKLMRFKGCGFLGTDKMFLDLGGNPNRLKRQALCAWYAVSSNSEGHTWFSLGVATGAIASSIAACEVRAERAMQLARRAGYLATRTENGVTYVAESRKASQEANLAELIAESKGKPHSWPEPTDVPGISEHQQDVLWDALDGPIAILAGRPGTGKTFTAALLIKHLASEHGSANILACAPTGKAAVRLTEALESYGVNIEATTGHRMLGVTFAKDGGGFEFEYDLHNPLEARYVILDEQSMSDTGMMLSLLRARAANTCYLLIGDINQLAPVGHGAPLRDMIAAGVPYGELIEIRRNSGRIVMACRDIVEQGRADIPAKFDFEAGENMAIVPATTPAIATNAMENFIRRCAEDGQDPVWDIQVITAVNEKSPLSRKALNLRLQAVLNPTGESRKGNPFRVGDKVICLKNSWFPVHNGGRMSDEKALVCNGELGEVLAIEPMRTIVRLQSPDRTIVIPHGQAKAKDGDSGSVGYWDLGYAISCHKSQGSEFPIVIVMLDEYGGARRLCTKNWIYTGISRGKKMTLLIGQKFLFDEMCKKPGLNRRTFLTEQILDSVHTADVDAIEGVF